MTAAFEARNITLGQVFTVHAALQQGAADKADAVVAADAGSDAALLLQWWQATYNSQPGDVLAPALLIAGTVMLAAGLLTGVSVTSIALTYTGEYPVNLFVLLGVVVGLPTLTLLLALPLRLLGRGNMPAAASLLGLAAASVRRLDSNVADYLHNTLWRYQSPVFWRLQKTLQLFTLAFLSAALLTFTAIISFSDIAFGWSSTLDIAPHSVHALTDWLSLPWQAWWPAAHPSLELVEQSRFFRMNPDNNPALLGRWWPFVAMCIAVWGLLPRVLIWLYCSRRANASARQALLNHAEVTALINRLRGAAVQFQSSLSGAAAEPPAAERVPPLPAGLQGKPAISWNNAVDDALQARLGDDQAAQADLFSQLPAAADHVCIAVKGWEPPLLEFNDFIAALRKHLGDRVNISVHALSLPGQPLDDNDLQAWRGTLGKLRDSKVYLGAPL